jgi:hypothetical protein
LLRDQVSGFECQCKQLGQCGRKKTFEDCIVLSRSFYIHLCNPNCTANLNIRPMKKLYLILALLSFSICCFSQSRYVSETTKSIVYTRDGGKCQCCGGSENLEYDHITPYSCGGLSDASNIQLLCQQCNRSKSNSCYCKVHDKKVGSNCCEGQTTVTKTTESSSATKTSTSTQCTGTTKKGARCKNKTTNASGRCYLH